MAKKKVWILGAGFSRSLGGPLLPELLSLNNRAELEAAYPENEHLKSPEANQVYGLYHYGRNYPEGTHPWSREGNPHTRGQVIWSDAEHFLDYLASAELETSVASRLKTLWEQHWWAVYGGSNGAAPFLRKPEDLAKVAQRILAAECCRFLKGVNPQLERWEPYVKWVSKLTKDDTVISFNYDRVIEIANSHASKTLRGGGAFVVSDDLNKATASRSAIVLKVHGSTDWIVRDHGIQEVEDTEYAMNAPRKDDVAIATPGPEKKTKTGGPLARLWRIAEKSIQDAEAITFIGYRFPPSDAEARDRILSAISENENQHLFIRTVLGLPCQDSNRLKGLLEYACRRRRIGSWEFQQEPLYAEDFLSLYNPDD